MASSSFCTGSVTLTWSTLPTKLVFSPAMRTTRAGTPTAVAVFRDLLQYHGVGGDPGPVPHLEGSQHLGPGGDQHVVADGGVALALVLPGAP